MGFREIIGFCKALTIRMVKNGFPSESCSRSGEIRTRLKRWPAARWAPHHHGSHRSPVNHSLFFPSPPPGGGQPPPGDPPDPRGEARFPSRTPSRPRPTLGRALK